MELKRSPYTAAYHHTILLIVPYGIETKELYDQAIAWLLLIVPYGIETKHPLCLLVTDQYPFNRTLWN